MINTLLNSYNFWENFYANLISDVFVAVVIGLIISGIISNSSKKKDEAKHEAFLKEKLRIQINMLWAEIEYNRSQLKLLIINLPKSNFIYPALETSAWELIDKSFVIDRLKVKDFANILHIYNRAKTLNRMYYLMLDKVNWIEDGKKPVVKRFYIDSLIDRSKELLNYIEDVIPEKLSK